MNILAVLSELIPVLGGLTGHPELGILASKLVSIGEQEIERRSAATGETRAEILADAAKTWDAAIAGADELKAKP